MNEPPKIRPFCQIETAHGLGEVIGGRRRKGGGAKLLVAIRGESGRRVILKTVTAAELEEIAKKDSLGRE